MNLGALRDQIAPNLGWTPKRLQAITAAVFRDPALATIAGLEVGPDGQYSGCVPTAGALALCVLAAIGETSPSIGWHSAVQRAFHAQAYAAGWDPDGPDPAPRCPISGNRLLGRSLIAALERPAIARCIVRLEASRAGPVWTVWSRPPGREGLARQLFVACHARELREALAEMPRSASVTLPGAVIAQLAEVLRQLGRSARSVLDDVTW